MPRLDVRIPASACPFCRTKISKASRVAGDAKCPDVGAVGCCQNCSGLIKFGEGMTLLRVTQEDLDAMTSRRRDFFTSLAASVARRLLGEWIESERE